jgi:hypothetical protein
MLFWRGLEQSQESWAGYCHSRMPSGSLCYYTTGSGLLTLKKGASSPQTRGASKEGPWRSRAVQSEQATVGFDNPSSISAFRFLTSRAQPAGREARRYEG